MTALPGEATRRFVLYRRVDHSGVSGRGVVADGALWPDGHVALRWRGPYASTVAWESLAGVEAVHGHGGDTVVVWVDEAEDRDGAGDGS